MLFAYAIEVGIGPKVEAIVDHSWAGVEYAAVTSKFILSQLFKLGFGLDYKRSGVAAYRNNLAVNINW